jgi:hypothetical protein
VRDISVTPVPDKDFKDFLPGDAYYQIVEWKLSVARVRTVVKDKTYKTQFVNISDVAQELRPNDRMIIEIVKVRRRNFKGEWEEVKMPQNTITIIPVN